MFSKDTIEATLEYKAEAILGEGPVWDDVSETLYWVDILSGTLFIYDPHSKTNSAVHVGGHLGAVAPREKGGLVVAKESGFAFLDIDTAALTSITDPEEHIPGNRFNDAKCSPGGAFWAGTLSYDLDEGAGTLYRLNPDLTVETTVSGLTISNGMAWNRQGTRFFLIDSGPRHILSFDYDEASGEISNRSVLRTFEEVEGAPDGMTSDRDDHLWVALYGGSKVVRIDPVDGATTFEVHLPVPQPTSCTFGGSDLGELYITTARENMTDEEIARAPLSGSLFKAKLPYRGYPPHTFQG